MGYFYEKNHKKLSQKTKKALDKQVKIGQAALKAFLRRLTDEKSP